MVPGSAGSVLGEGFAAYAAMCVARAEFEHKIVDRVGRVLYSVT